MTMLTTVDNPFNPLTDWDSWLEFDMEKGHNTCSYLARVVNTSMELSDADYEKEVEQAIDEIIDIRPDLYKKIK